MLWHGWLTVTAVELLLEDLLGVFLGLLGSVGVVQVGLVAAGDLRVTRHIGGNVFLIEGFLCGV